MPEENTVAERQETVAPAQTESHESASETRPGPETSRVNIEDLSHEAYQKYMATGKLPPEIEPKPDPKKPENLLEKLSEKELSHWHETGDLPERLAEHTTAASKEKLAEAKPESKEPEFVRLGDTITPEAHEAAVKTYGERMEKAWKAAGDYAQFKKEAAVVYPTLCGGNKQAAKSLLGYLDNAFAHMAHPADALREFIRNPQFRGQIEKSGPDQIIAILGKFDREFQTPKRVPAPATSISGKSTAPVDEENAALSKGDVEGYFRAANAKDIARSKGRR